MGKIKKFFRYDNVGIIFVLPAFIYMLVFVGYSIVQNIILSMQDVTAANLVRGTKNFVLFENYATLFHDDIFLKSLGNTLLYTVLCLIFQFLIGFALALFFSKRFALAKSIRGILLVPWMIPVTVTALMFKLLFATDIGMFNYILNIIIIFHIKKSFALYNINAFFRFSYLLYESDNANYTDDASD